MAELRTDSLERLLALSRETLLFRLDRQGRVREANTCAERLLGPVAELTDFLLQSEPERQALLAATGGWTGDGSLLRGDAPPLEARVAAVPEGDGLRMMIELSAESLFELQGELGAINSQLTNLNRERVKAVNRLQAVLGQLQDRNEELATMTEELEAQNEELAAQAEELHQAHLEAEGLAVANSELHHLHELKNQFIGVVSHELKTPLNFITGFSSLVEDEVLGPLNERQSEAMGRVLEGAHRLEQLIEDLLDASMQQAGKLAVRQEAVPLAPLLQGLAAAMAPAFADRTLTLAPTDAVAIADATRLHQVLRNLLSNAAKFTPAGGGVTVSVAATSEVLAVPEGHLAVCVADDGIGIPLDRQARLFEAFYQVDGTNTRAYGGTGLGLSIVRGLVEAMGGTVGVKSAPGEGSRFGFTLPRA